MGDAIFAMVKADAILQFTDRLYNMTIFIIILIAVAAIFIISRLVRGNQVQSQGKTTEEQPLKKLLDLNTTTVADRQRAYNHGYRQQLLFDEVQRKAEADGDIATLEAIRLGSYTGPFPELKEDVSNVISPKSSKTKEVKVQELDYFCIKDKGYHVSVWPKDQRIGDYLEFPIAGLTHVEDIDNYLGEFVGTLEADPTNPYDPNAIKILASDGYRIGYVPKDQTQYVRDFTSLPCKCYCYIGDNEGTYYSDCYICQ